MTAEQKDELVAALQHERKTYEVRIAAVQVGKQDPLGADKLESRIEQVDAEIARLSGAPVAKKQAAKAAA